MVKAKKVYIASGWFTAHTRAILDELEVQLGNIEGLDVYSPRRDGTKLTPNEFHDTETRRKVFQDNVDNIASSDFIIANLDGKDGHLDTGTVWEVGMASALGVPVIGFELEPDNDGRSLLGGVVECLSEWVWGYDTLVSIVNDYIRLTPKPQLKEYEANKEKFNKVIVIGPDYTEDHDRVNLDVFATINASGTHTRLVDKPSTTSIGDHADEIFNGVDYMVAVVDDRHPAVAWAMGQAFVRKLPIISFTNFDYGINLMLLLSIIRHVKGVGNLIEVISEIQEKGLDGIEKVDYADVKAI